MDKIKLFTSIRIAVVMAVFTALLFIFLFVYIGINQRKIAYEESKRWAQEVSHKAAMETESYLHPALVAAQSMEEKVIIYKKLGGNRSEVTKMLINTIDDNPNFMAAWIQTEPMAYDKKDYLFKNKEVYDDRGTMSVTYFKFNNSILFEKNEINDFQEDYYTIPKETKQELILNPFFYTYHGHNHQFYQTSAVVPILLDSVFLGVLGIDIDLADLQNKLSKIRPYTDGFVTLITNSGTIVSHRDTVLINKNFYSCLNSSERHKYQELKRGDNLFLETKSEFSGLQVFRFFYPINVGKGTKPWSIMVEIPLDATSAQSKQHTYVAVAILLVGLLLLAFLILNLIDRNRFEIAMNTAFNELDEQKSELIKSEKKYRDLIELLPQSIWETDLSGKFTYVNKQGLELYGYSHNDLLNGVNMADVLVPEDRKKAFNKLTDIIKSKTLLPGDEYVGLKNGGIPFPTRVFASAVYENNQVVGFRGVTFDMTDIKNAQLELKESEERYKTMVEAFPDIIMLTNLNGEIIFANKALELTVGLKKEDYSNPNRTAKIHPDDSEFVRDTVKKLLASLEKHTGIIENRFIDTKGKIHWFSGIISKLYLNNEMVLQTISRDITEQKYIQRELDLYRFDLELMVKERTDELEVANEELNVTNEELLSQRERLEESLLELRKAQQQLVQAEKMASLGILVAGVAHEINNPLNYINGGVLGIQTYLEEHFKDNLEDLLPLIEAVNIGVDRAADIVKSLNRFSRQSDSTTEKCNLHSVINSCLVILKNQLRDRIEIIKDFSSESIELIGNEGKMHQVFLNILTNSSHAIADKGTIEICTQITNNKVIVTIKDNGSGIKNDDIKKIFDPFFTTKEPGKGTGLGLSITYQIVQEMNGYIEYESIPNIGTTAILTFPLQKN